jgi:Ser/Thr protein kinase RdoA (MazF antagonist)
MPGPPTTRETRDEETELQQVLSAWPVLDAPLVQPMRGGHLHRTWAVRDGAAEFILQRVNPVFSPRIHDNIVAVTEHLRAKGIEVPSLERTREGRAWLDLGESGRFRLMTRLPGVALDRCSSSEQARSAGALVAGFHGALVDFESPLEPVGFPFHDTPRHLADLEAALAKHREHPRAGEVAKVAQEIRVATADWAPFDALPARVIHGDLKFNNLLFDGDRARALIDLDTLARMPLYYDLGDAWRSWCNRSPESAPEAELDLEFFESSATGYLSALGFELERAELASLAESLERLAIELCARFAADVLEESYWAWDSSRYPDAASHNWVRARGQLSLYHQARETRDRRLRFLLS